VVFTWSNALYRTPLTGPAVPLGPTGVSALELGPDHAQVLYVSGTSIERLPVDGSQPALVLVSDFPFGGETMQLDTSSASSTPRPPFLVTPDGAEVVFVARGLSSGVRQAFRVPADASLAPEPVSDPTPSGRVFRDILLSLDGKRLLFLANVEAANRFELFSSVLETGATIKLNRSLGTAVTETLRLHPDGEHVLFAQGSAPVYALWIARLDGSRTSSLSGTIAVQTDFQVAPDGRWVYFRGSPVPNRVDLYRASLAPHVRRKR